MRYCSAALAYDPESGKMLICTNKKHTAWTFPKGGQEPGLSSMENAAKECFEETGYRCSDKGFSLGTYEIYKKGEIHHIEVFALALLNSLPEGPGEGRGTLVCAAARLELRLDTYLMPFVVKLDKHLLACAKHEAAKK